MPVVRAHSILLSMRLPLLSTPLMRSGGCGRTGKSNENTGFSLTGSKVAERLLDAWESEVESFRKVMPKDYRRVLAVMAEAKEAGLSEAETAVKVMEASHG